MRPRKTLLCFAVSFALLSAPICAFAKPRESQPSPVARDLVAAVASWVLGVTGSWVLPGLTVAKSELPQTVDPAQEEDAPLVECSDPAPGQICLGSVNQIGPIQDGNG